MRQETENRVINLDRTAENNLARDHYLGLCVADPLLLLLLLPVLCESFRPPPAPPLLSLWVSLQVHRRQRVVPQRFRLPRRCSDDAQVAGVDDYFAKVQH